MEEETVDNEVLSLMIGSKIRESDKILKLTSDQHFNRKLWHFTTHNN